MALKDMSDRELEEDIASMENAVRQYRRELLRRQWPFIEEDEQAATDARRPEEEQG